MNLSTIPLIINGEEITTSSLYPVYSHKHAQNKIFDFSYLNDYEKQIPEICDHAEKGLEEWSSMPFTEKRNILKKALELLVTKRDELVEAHKIIGGPTWFSEFNVEAAVGQLEEYISQLSQPDGVIPKSNHCDLALTFRQPVGTVLSISPWNAPVVLGTRSIVGPLAAGCSVIVKSSEKAPHSAYILVRCFLDAGIPKNALQLVHLKPEDNPKAVELFIRNKTVKKVHFTGSTSTGRAIATTAASNLKQCLLELGGKNYSIVEEDADLDKASKNILWSSWCHMGQICMSTDKTYIHESIYDSFLKTIKATAESMMKDPDYKLPNRDEGFARNIGRLVSDAVAKGANIEYGSETKFSDNGENVPVTPLIITNVTSDMLLDSTETFGPVLSVYKYKDVKELVSKLNNDQSCLKTAIWSTNTVKALKIAKKIQCGGIHINNSTVHDEPTIAHGGIKESGQGRVNSSWGIDEFSYVKTITIDE